MIKGFKIRLYPTKEQEQLMWKHIHGCRFIWNYMLALQKKNYDEGGKYISGFGMINLLKPLKNDGEHEWFYEISNTSLQKVCRDLDRAYAEFFNKSHGFPKFKSRKKAKTAFPVNKEYLYFLDNRLVQIQKLGKVKYKTDFNLPLGRGHKFSNARITYVRGKWILSFGMECENQTFELNDSPMGIDLGVKDLAIAEFKGECFKAPNINKSKRMRTLKKQLKHTQRSISRKYEANRDGNKYIKTKNIEREEAKLRHIYARISNIRNNYIHQTTHDLASMLPKRVVMEDLNVKGMMKNKHMSKAIQEQCWHEFLRQMKYKCEWRGIEFKQANRFYPSSKTCSCCGHIKRDLKRSDRTYYCSECGAVIDRDYNAAINLSRYVA